MKIPLYQIDAFTGRLFGGNPAAVCPLESWLPEKTMQAIAAENNISETAFLVENGDHYDLRWFTPTADFVSRCFVPKFGIPEDPVTGSAHCELTPYTSLH